MSLMPASLDHHRPAKTSYLITPVGLAVVGLCFFAGVETLGWSETSAYAWKASAILFLVSFISEALIRLFRGNAIDHLAEWAPRIEFFFIATLAGSWALASAPFILANTHMPSVMMVGSVTAYALILGMLVTSRKFFPYEGRFRARAYDLVCATLWTIFFLTFLDKYAGPHAPDYFLPAILLLLIGGVLVRFAAAFKTQHPALFG